MISLSLDYKKFDENLITGTWDTPPISLLHAGQFLFCIGCPQLPTQIISFTFSNEKYLHRYIRTHIGKVLLYRHYLYYYLSQGD